MANHSTSTGPTFTGSGSKSPLGTTPKTFHLLRYFVPICLAIILLTALSIQLIYRHAAVNTVIDLGETTNVSLAQTVLSSIRPQLAAYLKDMSEATPEAASSHPIPPELEHAIQHLITETAIVRIKIYNLRGVVIYSTLATQIGQVQADNLGVKKALGGEILSEMVYSDSFNKPDQEPSENNMIQSYLPAKVEPFGTILGAFEIYYDGNPLVRHTEYSQLKMLAALCGVFLLMFVLLVTAVWRADTVMTRQDHIIRERTHMLEFLTAQMLSDQEAEKKNIAYGLHESVAQTLCAIKMRLETLTREADQDEPQAGSIADLIGYIQEAINETSGIAANLRPSTLDELGLLKTLVWLVRDLEQSYPQLTIDKKLNVAEDDISQALKIIIFRIVQDTLTNLASQTEANQVSLGLSCDQGKVQLEIMENSRPYASQSSSTSELPFKALLSMRERTFLSGGTFTSERNSMGHTHRSQWDS